MSTVLPRRIVFPGFLVAFGLLCSVPPLYADPFIDGVKGLEIGANAGFGAGRFPRVIFGPPRGFGLLEGSVHVFSLGHGGSITVAFRDNFVFDGPGDDLIIFENAFHVGSESGPFFTEYATVEISADNRTWHLFPFDAATGAGLAGTAAVLSHPANEIDPFDPQSGGDRFDLEDLGVEMIRFVRLTDGGDSFADYGNLVPPGDKGGFDLDSVGAINSSAPGVVVGTVTSGGLPVADARVKLVPADGTRKKRRWTAGDGSFRFGRVLPVGELEVRVRKIGVGSASEAIYLDLDQLAADVDIALD